MLVRTEIAHLTHSLTDTASNAHRTHRIDRPHKIMRNEPCCAGRYISCYWCVLHVYVQRMCIPIGNVKYSIHIFIYVYAHMCG